MLGLIDYLVLLVLPGADMLLMDWVAVGRICKGGDYSPLQNIVALIANQRAISPPSILIKLKLQISAFFLFSNFQKRQIALYSPCRLVDVTIIFLIYI